MANCKHKDFNILASKEGPFFSGFGWECKQCGAVKNSVDIGSKWMPYNNGAARVQLAHYFAIPLSKIVVIGDEEATTPQE